jgi:DNA-binding transcriptional ArsR family regulator
MAQIVVLKRAHFFSLDNDIIDVHARTIGAIGLAIYTTLARYANRKTGRCWPSIERLARTLDLARSTVKVYLRKLEDAGLVDIQERRDPAGDPTSNGYTLLDPSPVAVDTRLAAKAASAAPAPGGGRPPADPPPVATHPTGRPSAAPEPSSSPEPTGENHVERSGAAENHPQAPPSHLCPHPIQEQSHFGAITVCQHCWAIVDPHALSDAIERPTAHEEASPPDAHVA